MNEDQPASVADWDGQDVPRLMALEQLDRDLFRNRFNQRNANDALFGGQVLAQSLTAATATVPQEEGRPQRFVHSLHGYFVRAGAVHAPVLYHVDRTRDGGRFSTRRVVAMQGGEAILHMECGFHAPEEGYAHQAPMPAPLQPPETLRDLREVAGDPAMNLPDWVREYWQALIPSVEFRLEDPNAYIEGPGPVPRRRIWVRVPSGAGAGAAAQYCMLCYLSDYSLAGTSALSHTLALPGPELFMVSLDHAIWFHRPIDVGEWLLFDCDSPSAHGGRGLSRSAIHAQDGQLVASVAQEVLMRRRR